MMRFSRAFDQSRTTRSFLSRITSSFFEFNAPPAAGPTKVALEIFFCFFQRSTVRLTSIDHPQIEGAYLGIVRCKFHFSCLRLGLC
jgi:hypothetical protein